MVKKRLSFFYFVFQQYLKFWHRIYYRSIKIIKYTQVPAPYPVIYAPNHQNALMDALAILLTDYHQPFFLARADIFKSKFIASFLNRMKILPVYRIRDGAENLGKNDEIFKMTSRIFKQGSPLGIFPEANHSVIRSLRPLKKGVVRVAFLAESENDWKLNLHIIPMGIYYSDIQKMNQDLVLQYGKAIPMSNYRELYEQNEVAAFNQLRKDIAEGIREHIVDIPNDAEYSFKENIRDLFQLPNFAKYAGNPVVHSQEIVARLNALERESPEDYSRMKAEYGKLSGGLPGADSGRQLHDYFRLAGSGWAALLTQIVFVAPLALLGNAFFFLPHTLLNSWIRKKIADPCFRSTLYFSLSWLFFTLWILVFASLAAGIFPLGFVGSIVSAVICGMAAIRWNGLLEQVRNVRQCRSALPIEHLNNFHNSWSKTILGK